MSASSSSSPPSPPVSAVLGSSRRPAHLRTEGLSDTQLIRHSRGAQSLRSTLFDATIPFGFTPLFEPTPPAVRASRPLAPVMIQDAGGNGAAGTFVFARQTRTPMQEAVDPSTNVLAAFLPLSMPPHLTPRSPSTSWTSTRSVSPSPSQTSSTSRCVAPSTSWAETLPPPLPSCYFDPIHHPSKAPSPSPSKKTKTKKRRTKSRDSEGKEGGQDEQSFEQFLAAACAR